jgi:hypothetical protein
MGSLYTSHSICDSNTDEARFADRPAEGMLGNREERRPVSNGITRNAEGAERLRAGQTDHADELDGEEEERAREAGLSPSQRLQRQRAVAQAGSAAVRRMAGASDDLLAGTHAPSAAEKSAVGSALHPEKREGPAAPLVDKGLRRDLFEALDRWMDYAFKRVGPKATHDLAALTPQRLTDLSKVVQDAVRSTSWGRYFKASFAIKNPGCLGDAAGEFDLGARIIDKAKAKAAITPAALEGWVMWMMAHPGGGGPTVLKDHHVDTERDRDALGRVAQQYLRLARREEWIRWFILNWSWEGAGGAIYMGPHESDAGDEARKDGLDRAHQRRAGRWGTFHVLLHEYLHAAAHDDYSLAMKQGGLASRIVGQEGGADHLRERIWAELLTLIPGNAALRVAVEGVDAPFDPKVLPHGADLKYYPDKEKAAQIAAAVGERNFAAAYFLGRLDLIGVEPPVKKH